MEEEKKIISTRQFYSALLFSSLIKAILALGLPLTGDEAYHYLWGKYLDIGYYDHPPLIGWLMHLSAYLGVNRFVLRLPTIFFGIIIGWALYLTLKNKDKNKALIVAILFWISPFNLLNIIITNDAPLLILTFMSGLFFFLGFEKKQYFYFLLAGFFLGLAFSAKYFAGLLAVAYVAYVLIFQRNKKALFGLAGALLPAIPFVLLNGYWNYTHCWSNIVFNFFSRHENPVQFSPVNFLVFLVEQIYLLTPIVFFYFWKDRSIIRKSLPSGNLFWINLILFGLPIFAFSMASFFTSIGLHWTLSYIPFAFFLFFALFSFRTLRSMIKPMIYFSAGHLLLIFSLLVLFYLGTFNTMDWYKKTVISIKAREISVLLKPVQARFLLATESYDDASMLQYYSGQMVTQFGKGSQFGRQFDFWTDFSKYQGKDILIIKGGPIQEAFFRPFFDKVEIQEHRVGGHPIFFVFGYQFKYDLYKEKILRPILISYYSYPWTRGCGKCYFRDHYFGRP